MRRFVLACVGLMAFVTLAEAQPTLSLPSIVVNPGASVAVTVNGVAGENFAVIASTTNSGFSYSGVALAVGTDVTILATGVLGAGGTAVVSVTPPFPAYDRFYIQGATSPSPAFAPLNATPGVVLLNSQEARVYLAVGGGVNANGSSFAMSPGVTSTRTAVGTYQVNFAGQFSGPNVIPNITSFTAANITTITSNNGGFTVTFSADTGFFFTATPIRR
ncbi:MAG: hypothetical protein ABI880_10885 [Acidobacteriota bacterium]